MSLLAYSLITIITRLSWLLYILIMIRVILSWFPVNNNFTELIYNITDPILKPFKDVLDKYLNLPIDLSPLLFIITVEAVELSLIHISIGYTIDEIEKVLDSLNTESFLESGSDLTNLDLDKKESLKKYSFYINFDNELNYSLPKGLRETEELYLTVKNLLKNYENIKNFDNFPIPIRVIATNLNKMCIRDSLF